MTRSIFRDAKAQRGLTLIELMVVVAVLAILATIVVPTYDRYVTAARRAEGRAAATEAALAEERFFSIFQRYEGDFSKLVSQVGLDPELGDGLTKKYYSLAVVTTTTSFVVTATRLPAGADADCTAMTLDGFGNKGGQPTPNKCW